jgi:hypothetical protein
LVHLREPRHCQLLVYGAGVALLQARHVTRHDVAGSSRYTSRCCRPHPPDLVAAVGHCEQPPGGSRMPHLATGALRCAESSMCSVGPGCMDGVKEGHTLLSLLLPCVFFVTHSCCLRCCDVVGPGAHHSWDQQLHLSPSLSGDPPHLTTQVALLAVDSLAGLAARLLSGRAESLSHFRWGGVKWGGLDGGTLRPARCEGHCALHSVRWAAPLFPVHSCNRWHRYICVPAAVKRAAAGVLVKCVPSVVAQAL